MSIFTIHTAESAPKAARPILENAQKAYGFLPNLLGALAEAPAALEGYLALSGIADKSSFTAAEVQIAVLATSRLNECDYCMAAHSTIAGMKGVDEYVIEALRDGTAIADDRLEALRSFTEIVVEKRGWADDDDVQAFLGAGFTRQNILDVVLIISMKTLSNYANHLAKPPVDAAFQPRQWQPRKAG